MKKRLKTGGLILICVILASIYIVVKLNSAMKMPNSFRDTGYLGNALFLDTLKALEYDVTYEIKEIEKLSVNRFVMMNGSGSQGVSEDNVDKLLDFAQTGGKVMLLLTEDQMEAVLVPETDDQGAVFMTDTASAPFEMGWEYPSGGVMIYDLIDHYSNIELSTQREEAYTYLEALHPYIKDGVSVNEYFMFVTENKRSLWSETPETVKFVLFAFLVCVGLFFWYKGKRFGAKEIYYEEVEADENSYPKAVAALYLRAKHWEILPNIYFNALKKKIQKSKTNPEGWNEIEKHLTDMEVGRYAGLSQRKKNKFIRKLLQDMQTVEKEI